MALTARVTRGEHQRFITATATPGTDLRHATIDDVQSMLKTVRVKEDGSPVGAATITTQVAAINAPLGFAHQVDPPPVKRPTADQDQDGP